MVAAPKHYMPAQMSLAAIIPSAWMSHVSIWLRSVVDLTNSSQCRPIQTFPSPRFPYSNPIFDNPPLIALPAIHWAEIEKKKTNPIGHNFHSRTIPQAGRERRSLSPEFTSQLNRPIPKRKGTLADGIKDAAKRRNRRGAVPWRR